MLLHEPKIVIVSSREELEQLASYNLTANITDKPEHPEVLSDDAVQNETEFCLDDHACSLLLDNMESLIPEDIEHLFADSI
jgi:hypothetical protein